MNKKTCTSCKVEQTLDRFHKDVSRFDGLSNRCKSCRCKYQESFSKNCIACGDEFIVHGNKKAQVYCGPDCQRLYLVYGISKKDRDSFLDKQGGVCAICKSKKPLSVDHCHATGHVRGLLCTECNTAIGTMSDDSDRLRRAADYIDAFDYEGPRSVLTR